MATERGNWGSRLGFILAATGSAVGLGNVWGFPTQAGQGGGAAFVLVYLICVVLICSPIVFAEVLLGRYAQLGPAGAVRRITPQRFWWVLGALAVSAGVFILSFYSVIAGWTLRYLWLAVTGGLAADAEGSAALFGQVSGDGLMSVVFTALFLLATAWCVNQGIRKGIEKAARIMMPLLLGLLVILAIRAVTLPGAAEGLRYYLQPDLSKAMDPTVMGAALGQAFFSLSLGMGALITYGSYLSRQDGIAASALWIVALDTSIALLAGFIIFPVGFSIAGFDPTTSGPGLIFTVLPRLFAEMPGGPLFGGAFFLLLSVAALTSTISLLEVPVSHCVDALGWSRQKAVAVVAGAISVLAIPSALGNGAVGVFTSLPGLGIGFLDLMVSLWNEFALPVGGCLTAVFIGRVWGVDRALAELRVEGRWMPVPELWSFMLRWVCPAAIALILVATLAAMF